MKVTFLGTGPSTGVPKSKNGRTNSSVYVTGNDYAFVVDCSDDFEKQAEREDINRIDFILQTHAHSDAMGGLASQIKDWMDDHGQKKIPVYCEKKTWDKITERVKEHDYLEPNFIKTGEKFKPEGKLSVIPFRLKHSIQEGFPTVGFRFNDIVYSEDVDKIPEESEKYYKDADIIIFDAAMWFDDQIKGHHNVGRALDQAKKYHPKKFILTQAGRTYPSQDKAEDEIQEYWNKNRGRVETKIILAYDGLSISMNNYCASLSSYVKKLASDTESLHWIQKLENDYGLSPFLQSGVVEGPSILRQCHQILSCMPSSLINACGINRLEIRSDMGPNKPFYPNHGYFVNHSVTLNSDIFINPDIPNDFISHEGYFTTRPEQTLLHEFGHGYDEYNGTLSLKPEWLQLSGWSPNDSPELRQLVIRSKDFPERRGDWYYRPDAEFTRFYGKLSPWDDWADCFAFFVRDLKSIVPSIKCEYFDSILNKYK
jgi:phosphoribosyl 1,2-cyclic phosphodiesterase